MGLMGVGLPQLRGGAEGGRGVALSKGIARGRNAPVVVSKSPLFYIEWDLYLQKLQK